MRSLYDELGGQNAVHPVDEELFKVTEKKTKLNKKHFKDFVLKF